MMTITGLYIITDHEERLEERVASALCGGARIVQYRDKVHDPAQQKSIATRLLDLCHQHHAIFIINDDPNLAAAIGADGVHLGQQDASISEAREILGQDKIIGVSTRTIEQAVEAEADGVDYIAVGSMYQTDTKTDAVRVGPERLREIKSRVNKPLVAIGGIDRCNAAEVLAAGADSLAVISAVMGDSNPALAAREIALTFNQNRSFPNGRVLTIAGSDSGGGAGIQADLKTITLLGGYGMSAITALTAQNSLGVKDIQPSPPDFIDEQISTVLDDFGADTIKTGMLFSAEIVEGVAKQIRSRKIPAIVDPVMIAKGGTSLLKEDSIKALKEKLIPETYLLTPNLPETEALVGFPVPDRKSMKKAAVALHEMGARYVLIKGGHLAETADDLLYADDKFHPLPSEKIDTAHTHGTGCSYSAAIATLLAQGYPVEEAVRLAKKFIHEAIRTAPGIGSGHGPINHWQGAMQLIHRGHLQSPEK